MAICPQMQSERQELVRQLGLAFPILGDPGNRVAADYGLRYRLPEDMKKVYQALGVDLPKVNGEDSWTLPLPARYVIDADGRILKAEVSVDYRERPEPEETVEYLASLA